MIRTKIVATMGPATAAPERMYELFKAGVDVCRLNFSHGDLESHAAMLRTIREVARRINHPLAILGDLCGPKIRLGKVDDVDGTGGMPVNVGDEMVIQREPILGARGRVSTTYPNFVDDVKPGDRVLIEDGMLRFLCTDKNDAELRCQCLVGGVVKSAKGINLPNTHVNVPSITERDWQCADWAVENDLDYLALSFVRSADDLHQLRKHLRDRASDIHLIAKVEKAEAIRVIDAIVEASDGLMVARGDLGVEMDVAQVPIIQKDLVRRCRAAGKPVIVATQMLQSMIENASPTRAEVSDVANAIFDGTDAVMLSGETSVGKFAAGAVHTMAHIAEETEKYLAAVVLDGGAAPAPDCEGRAGAKKKVTLLSATLARGVWEIVQDQEIRLVVIWSQSGSTARIFSRAHFPVPIVALSSDRRSLRRMTLHYGVTAHEMDPPDDVTKLVDRIDALVREEKLAETGERVVIVAGTSLGTPGTMNGVIIHTVGQHWNVTPAPGGHSGGVRGLAVGIENT